MDCFVLYPAIAFSVGIIGFNLLGEGLRLEFDKRNSRVITWIRGIPSFLSPLRLIYEIRNIEVYRASVRRKLAFYGVVLLIIFFPHGRSPYKFDYVEAFNTMDWLSSPEYEGRRAGSGKNGKIAEMISERLKAYGVQPYDGTYIHEYDMESAFNIKDSTMKVSSEISGTIESIFRKDYSITTPQRIYGTYELEYVTIEDLSRYMFDDSWYQNFHGKVMLIDTRGLNDILFMRFVGVINNAIRPKALVYTSRWESKDIAKKRND
ncbi:MAG: hypothetical protein ACM3TR_10355 [Caulobacteraceae bacterium]